MSKSQVPNSFRYTKELLETYSAAALKNAKDLIKEGQLLLSQGHLSRAYFIGVVAIEEIGKSFTAFDAQGRNLNDSAVTAKLRTSLENHYSKINAAFHASILSHGGLRNELQGIIDLMIALKYGREPSMYTDIDYKTGKVKSPHEMVREVAATDCIRLAQHCYYKTDEHMQTKEPTQRTKDEDSFYGMKGNTTTKLFNTEDFWWFYIANMEAGENDLSRSVIQYQHEFLSKGRLFKGAGSSNNDT